jgi:hypothetical protein
MNLISAIAALVAGLLPFETLARLQADSGNSDEGEKKNMRAVAEHKARIDKLGERPVLHSGKDEHQEVGSRRRVLLEQDKKNVRQFERLEQNWLTSDSSTHDKVDKQKPFFGDDNQVHILQMGDETYTKTYAEQMSVNQKWAKCAGYQYHFESFEQGKGPSCIYTKKVKAIRDFILYDIPINDWMIYVDLDANYQAPDCREFEKVLWKEQHQYNFHEGTSSTVDGHQCEVVTSVTDTDVNTGIVLVKVTEQTRELMESWYQLQLSHGFCHGPADQLSFQEVILEKNHIDNYSFEECFKYEHSSPYGRRKCSMDKLYGELEKARESLSPPRKEHGYNTLPLGQNVCFFGCNAPNPLQCHFCHDEGKTCKRNTPLFDHIQKWKQ